MTWIIPVVVARANLNNDGAPSLYIAVVVLLLTVLHVVSIISEA